MLPVRGLRRPWGADARRRPRAARPGRPLPRSWVVLGVAFLLYTVLRLAQMTVWLVRALW